MALAIAPTGTLINGTLRPDDLIAAYAGALESLVSASAANTVDEARMVAVHFGILADVRRYVYDSAKGDPDLQAWLLERLYDCLQDYAPDGWYFGANEGDGADFGYWPDGDYIEELVADARLVLANIPTADWCDN